MFKKLLKKKQHDYELMCEDFTRCLAHTVFDAQMTEKEIVMKSLKKIVNSKYWVIVQEYQFQ